MEELLQICAWCEAEVPLNAKLTTIEFHSSRSCQCDEVSEPEGSDDSQHSHGGQASGEDAVSSFFANSEGGTREVLDSETIVVADLLDTLNSFEDDVMEEEWEGTMPQGIPDDVFDDAYSLDGVSDDDDDDSYNYCLPLSPISELEDEELVELCQPTALLEITLRGGLKNVEKD